MPFLYILPDSENAMFKIGVSVDPLARMSNIGAKWDREKGRLCEIAEDYVYKTERAFHKAFKEYRVTPNYQSGNSEWFRMEAYAAAVGMAHAMMGPLKITKIVDLLTYQDDNARGKLGYLFNREPQFHEMGPSPGRTKAARQIRERLTLSYLMQEATRWRDHYSFVPSKWQDLFYARLFAIHGRAVDPAVIQGEYEAIAAELNSMPQHAKVPPYGGEHAYKDGLREYHRRLGYYNEEQQLMFAIREEYQPDSHYVFETAPDYVLEAHRNRLSGAVLRAAA